MGKREEQRQCVYENFYSVAHFIYDIKVWVGEMVEVNLKIVGTVIVKK